MSTGHNIQMFFTYMKLNFWILSDAHRDCSIRVILRVEGYYIKLGIVIIMECLNVDLYVVLVVQSLFSVERTEWFSSSKGETIEVFTSVRTINYSS